jgi:hypothetical protein
LLFAHHEVESMSVNDLQNATANPLAPQVEAILREAAAFKASLARARTARIVMLLVLILFVVGVCSAFYSLGNRLQSKSYLDKVEALASERLDKNSDKYLSHVRKLSDKVGPVVRDTFSNQAKKDMPAFLQASQTQSKLFVEGLQKELLAKIDAFHQRAFDRQHTIMEKEFPALKDPKLQKRLSENFAVATDMLARKYYIHDLTEQLQELFTVWDNFPAAKEPGKGAQSTEDQFIASLLELLSYRVTQAPAPSAAP